MLHLSQIVLFLSVNGQRWSVKLLKIQIVHQGSIKNMLMNFQNQSIPSFCSTQLRVQAKGYTAQRNSVKDVAENVGL